MKGEREQPEVNKDPFYPQPPTRTHTSGGKDTSCSEPWIEGNNVSGVYSSRVRLLDEDSSVGLALEAQGEQIATKNILFDLVREQRREGQGDGERKIPFHELETHATGTRTLVFSHIQDIAKILDGV